MRVTVNPEAQASGDFGYAAPGEYLLRIRKVESKQKQGSEYPYLKWEMVFADPNVPSVEKNADGSSKKVGNIFNNTSLKPDAQFSLRDTCEALGLKWGDFDTDQCVGRELKAKIKIREYQGNFSNEVERFIPQGK